jgi:hypothetical protein
MKLVPILSVAAIILTAPVFAAGFKYSIVFPDSEEKVFILRQDEQKLALTNSEWNCVAAKGEKVSANGHPVVRASIVCVPTKGGAGVVMPLYCFDDGSAENKILSNTAWLMDRDKSGRVRQHNITLRCN